MSSTVGNPPAHHKLVHYIVLWAWDADAGTQSEKVLRRRITRCGSATYKKHELDFGGAVDVGDFDRAIIC